MDLSSDKNFASLTAAQWEDLCYSLLIAEGENVVKTDGIGGDEGIDAIEGAVDDPVVIYQFKHFPRGLHTKQVVQISRSLQKAMEHGDSFTWVLMCSADPNTAVLKKLDALKAENPGISIRFRFGSEIKRQLQVRRSVRRQFYSSEEDLFFEALEGEGKADFPQSFSRKARLINQRIEDDRFTARVSSDGDITEVQFTLQPWVRESVPVLNLTAKNVKAGKALKDLLERGIVFSLSGRDVEVRELVELLPVEPGETLTKVWTKRLPANDGSLVRVFAGRDDNSAAITVNLETERRGTREWVRSNVAQKDCPITLVVTFGSIANANVDKWNASCKVTGRLYGIRLSSALRGARFLLEVSKSGAMGLGGVDSMPSEASFTPTDHMLDATTAGDRLRYLEGLKRVFDLFGIDPILSDELDGEGVAKAIGFIQRAIEWADGGEDEGEMSFDLVPNGIYKTDLATTEAGEVKAFRSDYVLEVFGYRLAATIYLRVRNPTTRTEPLDGGGSRYHVRGLHTVEIADVSAEPL